MLEAPSRRAVPLGVIVLLLVRGSAKLRKGKAGELRLARPQALSTEAVPDHRPLTYERYHHMLDTKDTDGVIHVRRVYGTTISIGIGAYSYCTDAAVQYMYEYLSGRSLLAIDQTILY